MDLATQKIRINVSTTNWREIREKRERERESEKEEEGETVGKEPLPSVCHEYGREKLWQTAVANSLL